MWGVGKVCVVVGGLGGDSVGGGLVFGRFWGLEGDSVGGGLVI